MRFSRAAGEVVSSVETLVSCDVSLLSGEDAERELRRLTRARNQLDATCGSLADQAVRGGMAYGSMNAPSWLAGAIGVSERDARQLLKTQRKLACLPEVLLAARSGDLSAEKARAIANGAEGDLDSARSLLGGASSKSVEEIQEQARCIARIKAGSEKANHKRLRSKRMCSVWKDRDGLICTLTKNTPDAVGPFLSRLREFELKTPRESGSSPGAHRCDAFFSMFADSGGSEVRNNVFVHIDYEALMRGWTESGETSEVAGLGDIPVGLVQEMLNDCVLRVVLKSENKLIWYGTSDDELPRRIKQAVRAKFKHRCASCGDYGNQVDHIIPRVRGGTHAIDNLQNLCECCHASKTTRDAPWTSEVIYGRKRNQFDDTG